MMTIEARDRNHDGRIDFEVTSTWSDAGTLVVEEHYEFPADGGHATALFRSTQINPEMQHREHWFWRDGIWEEEESFDAPMRCDHRFQVVKP